jgi:hypothetical protein
MWLCSRPPHNHHARVHEALRALGLDSLPASADSLAYRVRLVAVHIRLCADAGAAFVLADASAESALATLLLEAADAISCRCQVSA